MPEVSVVTRTILALGRGGRQRDLRSRLTLGGHAAKQRLGRSENARRLGAHSKDAAGAWGQNLEVEIVMANSELLAGVAKGLLDGLSGELAVSVSIGSHVSVVSLVGLRAAGCWAGPLKPPMPSALPAYNGSLQPTGRRRSSRAS